MYVMAKSFRKFLKDNGIEIEDFESRLFQWNYEMEEDEPRFWIMDAFEWKKQPEGFDFWFKLHYKWFDICNTQEVKYGGEFPRLFKE